MRRCHSHPHGPRQFDHWLVCQHQIEIELWPASAEVYFRDERYADPVNTQARFDAAVFNAPDGRVKWDVFSLDGGPGRGQIDATGLYTAPDKKALPEDLPSGLTEVIQATAVANPMRQAHGYVTVVGRGPLPPLVPTVLVLPQRVALYRGHFSADPSGHNGYMDESNSRQVFRAIVKDSDSPITWKVGGTVRLAGDPSRLFNFDLTDGTHRESDSTILITAVLANDTRVKGWAKVTPINYNWPAIIL